ncbi:hypothetical protein EON77_00455 [bacterium]|nr:MAG: hypothetical protein EON77_00455 [bacterium]
MLPSLLALAMAFQAAPNPPQTGGRASTHNDHAATERTIFQTHAPYGDRINLRGDVAVVYGFEADMPARVKSWRERGYKVHLMTGVAWGEYADYYYGKWDGVNHMDEVQTRANGDLIGHGKDVYYISPGKDYGRYLAEGVRRALDVGVEAVHLEEPEFWTYGGYGAGFKREWQEFYKEPWRDPAGSPDARWRAAKLMYYLYRRALTQVFDSIAAYNKEKGTSVRCYVPTHSLLNYADWGIVSPESDLAKIEGCDGYIAQVWTGTAREPNRYMGVKAERTFETAFLEYGTMQNLVRSTGRGVWYLADPIEDNPNHDWGDYRRNYESTLVASLLQADVAQYEIAPWPERILNKGERYPAEGNPTRRVEIPGSYQTELGLVFNALKDMKQTDTASVGGGASGIGVAVSDTLMFQRGGPDASDSDFGHFYGLAMPFVKRGMPVAPIGLENLGLPGYLDGTRVLLMSYEGQKPQSPEVHTAIAKWVRAGGTLVFVDNDADPFNGVREWWNTGATRYANPRQQLFETLGLPRDGSGELTRVGEGRVLYLRKSPTTDIADRPDGAKWLADKVRAAATNLPWSESAALMLRRGPYVVAAGMDETDSPRPTLRGEYVDLFDPELRVRTEVTLGTAARHLLVDLARFDRPVIAASGEVVQTESTATAWRGTVEGMEGAPGIVLLRVASAPKSVTIGGVAVAQPTYDATRRLLWLRFPNRAKAQSVEVRF